MWYQYKLKSSNSKRNAVKYGKETLLKNETHYDLTAQAASLDCLGIRKQKETLL